jgi:cytosolic carboxypeptidase protein 2/3
MVNPDGVIVGNHRTSLAGTDLNRRFSGTSPYQSLFPEVEAVKNLMKSLQRSHNVEFFFDFHGHSAQSDVFAYAGYENAGTDHFLKCTHR